ncbi:AmmeMemoRadiSam system protein B [Corallincola platygyrae]|uniref:MEMO1 family protein ACFSJ3_11140 n=1 Tax=Corallincola platygyrae TaxID=1193278 RepID=A0ABW4XNJ8_9GAMM
MTVREAAQAGRFYPADGDQLAAEIARWLMRVPAEDRLPKAIIVPHAGYQFSGEIAASAYAQLKDGASQIHRVVVLGPNHCVPLAGIAVPSWEAFSTPLGQVLVDRDVVAVLSASAWVHPLDEAHRLEHALEVQLPFLQTCLDQFQIVPLVVGEIGPAALAELLLPFWLEPGCLIVVSSDLSHFEPYSQAVRHDRDTIDRICLQDVELLGEDACGCRVINGLMQLLKTEPAKVKLLDYCNSGDTAGDKSRVVGYASFAVYPQ